MSRFKKIEKLEDRIAPSANPLATCGALSSAGSLLGDPAANLANAIHVEANVNLGPHLGTVDAIANLGQANDVDITSHLLNNTISNGIDGGSASLSNVTNNLGNVNTLLNMPHLETVGDVNQLLHLDATALHPTIANVDLNPAHLGDTIGQATGGATGGAGGTGANCLTGVLGNVTNCT